MYLSIHVDLRMNTGVAIGKYASVYRVFRSRVFFLHKPCNQPTSTPSIIFSKLSFLHNLHLTNPHPNPLSVHSCSLAWSVLTQATRSIFTNLILSTSYCRTLFLPCLWLNQPSQFHSYASLLPSTPTPTRTLLTFSAALVSFFLSFFLTSSPNSLPSILSFAGTISSQSSIRFPPPHLSPPPSPSRPHSFSLPPSTFLFIKPVSAQKPSR